jgi:uncharacterized protein
LNEAGLLYDSNIWVALSFSTHPAHSISQQVFLKATPAQPALFCRSTQQSVLRLITTPAIMTTYRVPGMTNHDALELLSRFQQSPSVGYVDEPVGLQQVWHKLADRTTASPKAWMDAYLAAFAILGDLILVTLDKDFKAYVSDGLKLELVVIP